MSYVINNTLRAYSGADTPLTVWVRDEAGNRDFGGTVEVPAELTVEIGQVAGYPLSVATGLSPTAGRVDFTVQADKFGAGDLLAVRVKDGGEVVATGTLSIA